MLGMEHRGKRRGEQGSTAIEFLAVVPFAIMIVLLLWQLILVAYALVVAEATARDVARAAASGQDKGTIDYYAATNAPGMLAASPTIQVSGSEVQVAVRIRIPTVLRWFDLSVVERRIVMPLEPQLDGG